MTADSIAMRLFVVVPCFNEAAGIEATLDALARQDDTDFEAVFVDNASTDDTRGVIERYAARHPAVRFEVVSEPQKGTGAAADTGFRHAIARGATHVARTDADCLPRHDWIRNIKRAFARGADFVAGQIGHRTDEVPLTKATMAGLVFFTELMSAVSPLLPHNRGPRFRGPYVMAGGGNLATTAELYLASGGFPRIAIDEDNDDRALQNRIRELTPDIRKDRSVVVLQSTRRVREYGFKNTLLWYWNRKYRPEVVDIR